MKDGLRQSMAWLHTWAGLTCGWLLCAIFFTGSLSVFRQPITHWMQARPLLAGVADNAPLALEQAMAHLRATAPDARFWRIDLPARSGDAMQLVSRSGATTTEVAMHPTSAALLPAPWGRKTEGGRHFMRFHYTLHGGTPGYWLVGWAAMCALVALVSGVIVHRRIFVDFFTFRPGKGQRSWLDAHNASAVLALPFLFMIVYTGLAFFCTSYMPWPLRAAYGTEQAYEQLEKELAHGATPPISRKRSNVPAAPHALAPLLQSAERLLQRRAAMVVVEQPGDRQALVRVYARAGSGAPSRTIVQTPGIVTFDGVSGAVLQVRLPAPPAAFSGGQVHAVMEALHVVPFGGWPMKWLYCMSGLLGTAMIATGSNLFMVKRRRKSAEEFGAATGAVYRVVEALNVSALAGIGVASIAYFWANRLLPAALAGREAWEIGVFLWTWGATLAHALARPPARAWVEQFACAATLCLALPLLNQLTTGQQLWAYAAAGDGARAGVEATALAFGLLFACLAYKIHAGGQAKTMAIP